MIKIIKVKNYEEASDKAFEIMKEFIVDNAVLGLATGSTPLGLYERMVKDYKENNSSYKNIKTFNLDEYVGLPISHPESYYAFMHRNLFDHIDILKENVHLPSGLGDNLDLNAKEYDEMIEKNPIDIQILGIGSDGHVAFNEPGTDFESKTHITELAESTIKDNCRFFDNDISKVPTKAITQGIGTIMNAKHILMIATGSNKAKAIKDMVEGEIDTSCPASILQKHDNVTLIVDEEAASLLS